MAKSEDRTAALEDEVAIRRTLAEYFLLQDSGDIDVLKTKYWTHDIVAELLIGTVTGADALAARLAAIRAPRVDATGGVWDYRVYTHFLGNSAVSVRADEAVTTSSVLSISVREQRVTHETEMVFQGARYHDRLVRLNGSWRVARRHVVADWRFEPHAVFAVTPETYKRLELA